MVIASACHGEYVNRRKTGKMGLPLPPAPEKVGVYASVKSLGNNFYYISRAVAPTLREKVRRENLDRILQSRKARKPQRELFLNYLSVIKAHIGSLDKVKSFVKYLFCWLYTDFYEQPQVANGATQLLVDLFGEEIGAPSLVLQSEQ